MVMSLSTVITIVVVTDVQLNRGPDAKNGAAH
jgi:hypothetical protein